MINKIWLFLIISGVIALAVKGSPETVTNTVLDSANGAVTFTIGLIGVIALWSGLMKIAEEAGLTTLLSKLLKPMMRRIFPSIPDDHPALGAITMTISANLLGLGNAATPLGLKAMEEMQKLNLKKDTASDAMCTFLAMITAGMTLIPSTMIALRSKAGSASPTDIVGPTLVATLCSTTAALIFDRILRRSMIRKSRKGARRK